MPVDVEPTAERPKSFPRETAATRSVGPFVGTRDARAGGDGNRKLFQ